MRGTLECNGPMCRVRLEKLCIMSLKWQKTKVVAVVITNGKWDI